MVKPFGQAAHGLRKISTQGIAAGPGCQEILLDDFVKGAEAMENHYKMTVGFKYTCVLGYLFMMREIELSLMLASSVTVAAVAQQELLEKTFGKERLQSAGFPFAPTRAGAAASKEQVVHNVQLVAQSRGLQLKNHLGKDNFHRGGPAHRRRQAPYQEGRVHPGCTNDGKVGLSCHFDVCQGCPLDYDHA